MVNEKREQVCALEAGEIVDMLHTWSTSLNYQLVASAIQELWESYHDFQSDVARVSDYVRLLRTVCDLVRHDGRIDAALAAERADGRPHSGHSALLADTRDEDWPISRRQFREYAPKLLQDILADITSSVQHLDPETFESVLNDVISVWNDGMLDTPVNVLMTLADRYLDGDGERPLMTSLSLTLLLYRSSLFHSGLVSHLLDSCVTQTQNNPEILRELLDMRQLWHFLAIVCEFPASFLAERMRVERPHFNGVLPQVVLDALRGVDESALTGSWVRQTSGYAEHRSYCGSIVMSALLHVLQVCPLMTSVCMIVMQGTCSRICSSMI